MSKTKIRQKIFTSGTVMLDKVGEPIQIEIILYINSLLILSFVVREPFLCGFEKRALGPFAFLFRFPVPIKTFKTIWKHLRSVVFLTVGIKFFSA